MSNLPGSRAKSLVLAFLALSTAAGCGSGSAGGTGTLAVQVSGEELATGGLLFPTGSEVALSDGWELRWTHVLVTVDRVWLSANPDKSPSDQSQMDDVVAERKGPWAVDLHKLGEAIGAGGEGSAIPLFTLDKLDKKANAGLASGERYAFSYSTAAASSAAQIVNFEDDAEAKGLYAEMAAKGYSILYAGKATFKGTDCSTSNPGYDFAALPTSFDFQLGFATPSTYLNCQNQENQGDAFEGEEYQRGIAIKDSGASVAQLTFHLEHPLFSSVVHDSRLYFDQFAAPLAGKPADTVLTTDHLIGLDVQGFQDGEGKPLPWRSCDNSPLPAGKQRSFEVGSVPVDPAGDPKKALRDYRDFVGYVQSTQGHLNGGEGLCFTKRDYPSPP